MHSYARLASLMTRNRCLLRNSVAVGGVFSAFLITRDEEMKNEVKPHSIIEQAASTGKLLTTYDFNCQLTACEMDPQPTKQKRHIRQQGTLRKMKESSNLKKLRHMYNVKWERPLGEGGFGAVFLGKEKKTGDLGKNLSSRCWSIFPGNTTTPFENVICCESLVDSSNFSLQFLISSRCQANLKRIYQ